MDNMTETQELMRALARTLDGLLNDAQKTTGFVLLTFPFDGPAGQRTNYIANCNRDDVVVALKEIVARFEGQPNQSGRA